MLGPGAQIIDLGCGDGRWLLAAAKRFRDLKVTCRGYDLDERLLGVAEKAIIDEGCGDAVRALERLHKRLCVTIDENPPPPFHHPPTRSPTHPR